MGLEKITDMGVVIAAGGRGDRFSSGGAGNKLFADIGGFPVFIHTLLRFAETCAAENIVLVVYAPLEGEFRFRVSKLPALSGVKIICGGEHRMESVRKGLLSLPRNLDLVAVQDAARPLLGVELIRSSYEFAKKNGSAVVGRKITDTVKKADGKGLVVEDLDRSGLWSVETPQIFGLQKLVKAYAKAFEDGFAATDDAGVMRHSGHRVMLFENKAKNIKITFESDLAEARDYLAAQK